MAQQKSFPLKQFVAKMLQQLASLLQISCQVERLEQFASRRVNQRPGAVC